MDSRSESSASLNGRRVIITRARGQAQRLAAELERLGAEVVLIPTIEILPPADWTPVDTRLLELEAYDWLVFTSRNGVEHFLRRLDEIRHSRAVLLDLRIAAVGPGTRRRLEREGIRVDLQPSAATAADLARELVALYRSQEELSGLKILLPTSNLARPAIRETLSAVGAIVDVVEVYRTMQPAITSGDLPKQLNSPGDIVFLSPSALVNLSRMLDVESLSTALAKLRVTCIGRVTAEAATRLGLTVHSLADEPTVESIVTALRNAL